MLMSAETGVSPSCLPMELEEATSMAVGNASAASAAPALDIMDVEESSLHGPGEYPNRKEYAGPVAALKEECLFRLLSYSCLPEACLLQINRICPTHGV